MDDTASGAMSGFDNAKLMGKLPKFEFDEICDII